MDMVEPTGPTARQHWMSVLAKADGDALRAAWEALPDKPVYRMLRAPETGLVMVQARAGGTGRRFNFGEMTMTRCVVTLDDGPAGHSYVAGSDTGHAEIAAVLDGMLQTDKRHQAVMADIIDPLRERRLTDRRKTETATAATRVDFFTLVRGEDE